MDKRMDSSNSIFDVQTHASEPTGHPPLQPDFLTHAPNGNVFGWSQDDAMGWSPSDLGKDEYLILSTQDNSVRKMASPSLLVITRDIMKWVYLLKPLRKNSNNIMQFHLQASSVIHAMDARKVPQA